MSNIHPTPEQLTSAYTQELLLLTRGRSSYPIERGFVLPVLYTALGNDTVLHPIESEIYGRAPKCAAEARRQVIISKIEEIAGRGYIVKPKRSFVAEGLAEANGENWVNSTLAIYLEAPDGPSLYFGLTTYNMMLRDANLRHVPHVLADSSMVVAPACFVTVAPSGINPDTPGARHFPDSNPHYPWRCVADIDTQKVAGISGYAINDLRRIGL